MPMDDEIVIVSQLPKIMEDCKEHDKEIQELLKEPGFWDREIGALPD
jgi:hypothetical protein